jgi:hypothetical protein
MKCSRKDAKAKVIRDSLNPVREAFRRSQELMGQVGAAQKPSAA